MPNTTAFKKGAKPGPGRPKGLENKVTKELKTMILEALDGAGGVTYLQDRAKDPRTASAFLGLVGKVLPMQVSGVDGKAIRTVTRIELVAPGDDSKD